jgi:hypothetical protein
MLSKIISHGVYLSTNLVNLCSVDLTIVKRLSEGLHAPNWRMILVLRIEELHQVTTIREVGDLPKV